MVEPIRRSSNGPLARHNLPFSIATLVAAVALVWFSLVHGMVGTAETASVSTTQVAAAATPAEGPVESTLPIEPEVTIAIESPPDASSPLQALGTEVLVEGLNQPVFATVAPGDDRIFIVERNGLIRIYDPTADTILPAPFLDVTAKSNANIGIEVGLLGLAFHPQYEQNGRFFIYYTDRNNDTAVAEYARLDADHGDPDSEQIFIRVAREGIRHNAGMLMFGPDGYLYIAIGDGGLYDEFGQDNSQFLGSILRLDMDAGDPYAIPDDNPFATGGGAPELWAYGLRNPWRFSIDRASNTMYIGDVGQEDFEEVDAVALQPVGYNFGWPVLEGFACWIPRTGCDTSGKVPPVTAYDHTEGCSVTGGYVYRGSRIPEYFGHYFYADWCNGWVRSFEYVGDALLNERDWTNDLGDPGMITSFGLDSDGELLYTTFEGSLGRIIPIR